MMDISVRFRKKLFYNNNALETVVIDESVEYIGSKAFAKCPNLKKSDNKRMQ